MTSSWHYGPDEIAPAQSFQTAKLDEAVKLRLELDNRVPISIYTMFKRTVDQLPKHTALG
jgi:hypothetical protein